MLLRCVHSVAGPQGNHPLGKGPLGCFQLGAGSCYKHSVQVSVSRRVFALCMLTVSQSAQANAIPPGFCPLTRSDEHTYPSHCPGSGREFLKSKENELQMLEGTVQK